MIKNDHQNGSSMKAIREANKQKEELELKAKCEALALEKYTDKKLKEWTKEYGGIWFLPIIDDNNNIEKMAIMRPINRHILGYATTKLQDDGLYAFLESAMNECFIEGDRCIIDEDEYFLPASTSFNKIIEGKKSAMLKR